MSLPDLIEIPEGLPDDEVFEYIADYFGELHSQDPARVMDFTECISWVLRVVIARGDDKASILFRLGIILLNPLLMINNSRLSLVLAFFSPETIARRMKNWPAANWSAEDKQCLLNAYERDIDPKPWAVKEPPNDSVFFKAGGFRPMEQIRQRVPELNEIPPPIVKPPRVIHCANVVARRFHREVQVTQAPAKWEFDPRPLMTLEIF
jgi:hypothetical protein